MTRILATTAIVALIAAPGLAQVDADVETNGDASGSMSSDATSANAGTDAGAEAQADTEVEAEGAVAADGDMSSSGGASIATQGMSESAAEAAAGITADALIGAEVFDADESTVSTVSDLVLNDDEQVSQILIDVGGFLGIGARTVAIAMSEVEIETAAEGEVSLHLSMTEEQIAELPEYEG